MTLQEFQNDIRAGIPDRLPAAKPYDKQINHAPKRKGILTPEEEVLAVALEQQSRGADVVKFVTWSDSEEELMQNLAAIRTLKRELKVPFLFLSGGRYCRLHRAIGPYLGVCCWLCVERYDTFSSREQPLLRAMHTVVENLDLTAPRPTDF